MAENFNPSEHNIADVNAYLEENPTQLQTVLDAEKAGKNRPTLVADLEERVKSVPVQTEPSAVTVAPADQSTPNTAQASFFGKQYEVTPDGGHRLKRS